MRKDGINVVVFVCVCAFACEPSWQHLPSCLIAHLVNQSAVLKLDRKNSPKLYVQAKNVSTYASTDAIGT